MTGRELAEYNRSTSISSDEAKLGAVFSFGDAKQVTSRIGVSFISPEQACKNVDDEISEDVTIEDLAKDVKATWNEKILSKITTTSTDTANLELLYSSLYHMNLVPTNKSGENPLWSSSEPYYDDIFTFWDIVRSSVWSSSTIPR